MEKIARTETAAPPIKTPQNLRPPSAFPTPILSTPTADKDGRVSAKPAPDRNRGKVPSPGGANPQPIESPEEPPPRRATTPPSKPDLLPSAAAIPVSLEQVPSDTLLEGGDDPGPTPEMRVVAAYPAAPNRIETLAEPAPVQNREEGRVEQAPSQPVPTPQAAPESPKVQIGLLEVVVQAPASAPQETPLANKARTNIASRHYLRNM